MSPAPLLRLVDENGEIRERPCPQCERREDILVQYEKDIRVLKAKITKLERDVEIDARKDPLWPEAEAVFHWWAIACGHEGCSFDAEEFQLVKPHLKRLGPVGCLQAICGAAYDPLVTYFKNGRPKRHDDFALVFRSKEKVRSFAERVPGGEERLGWRRWLVARIEASLSGGV